VAADTTYVIRGGAQGRERLRLLSSVMGPGTAALLDAVGIAPGSHCLDVGCGGGDVAMALARRVGPAGRVTGVDFDEAKLAIARGEAEAAGLRNVAFEAADVTAWAPSARVDVAYARFLLAHLAGPAALLATLARHLRPGGTVIVEDVDFRGHFTEPPCAAHDRYVALYSDSLRARGGDPDIGPRLPGLLREAGFEDVRVRLHQPVATTGGIKDLTVTTLELVGESLLADGLLDRATLDATREALAGHMADPRTVHGGPRVVQAWGRVPG